MIVIPGSIRDPAALDQTQMSPWGEWMTGMGGKETGRFRGKYFDRRPFVRRNLLNRCEAKRAHPTRMPAGVVRVIYTVQDRHFEEVEWAYPVQTGNVDAILVLIGAALMVSIDSAMRAEKVLG